MSDDEDIKDESGDVVKGKYLSRPPAYRSLVVSDIFCPATFCIELMRWMLA